MVADFFYLGPVSKTVALGDARALLDSVIDVVMVEAPPCKYQRASMCPQFLGAQASDWTLNTGEATSATATESVARRVG